jgi:hypothetical protein
MEKTMNLTRTSPDPIQTMSCFGEKPIWWLWLVLFMVAGIAPCFAGERVWEPINAVVIVLVVLFLSWLYWRVVVVRKVVPSGSQTHAPTSPTLLTCLLVGAVRGFLLFVASLLAWFAVEIVSGGKSDLAVRLCMGAVFGALFGMTVICLSRRQSARRREIFRRGVLAVVLLLVLIEIVVFSVWTGPRDLALYPPARQSPYRLPWPAGARHLCPQGNRAVVSHRGFEEFAYDFAMPIGSDVCAARGGIVVKVEVTHDGNGADLPNNMIVIRHEDGTWGFYLHLQQGGSYVEVGDKVEQGQRIGASGNVGLSLLPHLHFHVMDQNGTTLPITFADVEGDGIPRMFLCYTSGNSNSR